MQSLTLDEIPSLNLSDFITSDPAGRTRFVEDLGGAFNEIGFVSITHHLLSASLQNELYRVVKLFFALPEEVKQKYEVKGLAGQRGYTSRGKEHAKGRTTGDLKEFYHIGQELDESEQSAMGYPPNVWPSEVPNFKKVSLEAFHALEQTGLAILEAIARYLDLPADYFVERVLKGNSILRPIHYFPIVNPKTMEPDAVRAAAHGDINLITLLMGASAEGLQVLRRDGNWIPVTVTPDQIVVNVGDMLERLTNGRLKSTIHRVVNPPPELMGTPRYSIPFFMHPRSEMDLSCLTNCVDVEHARQFEDITAGEFLNQRLAEIGLKK